MLLLQFTAGQASNFLHKGTLIHIYVNLDGRCSVLWRKKINVNNSYLKYFYDPFLVVGGAVCYNIIFWFSIFQRSRETGAIKSLKCFDFVLYEVDSYVTVS